MKPDAATMKRLEYLSEVGHMLNEVSNDNSHETYFLAKSSLDEFERGLKELELAPRVMDGMLKLVRYLGATIEKRKLQAGGVLS